MLVEVLHEDGSRLGDEEWEEHLSAHLANGTARWIQLNGWATTINWGRVLRPAHAAAIAARRRLAPPAALAAHPMYAVPSNGPTWACISCAIWASYRPRAVLHRQLVGSPIATSAPLMCLKVRARAPGMHAHQAVGWLMSVG